MMKLLMALSEVRPGRVQRSWRYHHSHQPFWRADNSTGPQATHSHRCWDFSSLPLDCGRAILCKKHGPGLDRQPG